MVKILCYIRGKLLRYRHFHIVVNWVVQNLDSGVVTLVLDTPSHSNL